MPKLIDRNIMVFNRDIIDTWSKEFSTIPARLKSYQSEAEQLEKEINRNQLVLDGYHKKLLPLDSVLQPLTEKINALESQRNIAGRENIIVTLKILEPQTKLLTLQSEWDLVAKDMYELQYANQRNQFNLNLCRSNIELLKDRLSTLSLALTVGEDFLTALRERPDELANKLQNTIMQAVTNYDASHPAHQSMLVRRCLMEISQNTDAIINAKSNGRIKYFQLCGLLNFIVDTAASSQNNDDLEFAEYIMAIASGTYVATDLPDDMALNANCIDAYKAAYPRVTDAQLVNTEREQFTKAMSGTMNRMQSIPAEAPKELRNLASAGMNIANMIKADKLAHEKNNPRQFDIKFATNVLQMTNQVFDKPGDIVLLNQYKSLAIFDEHGKPSRAKKIGGLILTFAGLAVAAIAMMCLLATFNVQTPLNLLHISVSNSWMARGIAAGCELTGIGMMLGGVGLFKNGMQKGLSKEMVDYANADEKAAAKNEITTGGMLQLTH